MKPSVIEAVSRFAQTEIISSLDMLALPVHVGHSGAFEVKTYMNSEIEGKKTCMFVAGCDKELGCTIVLRGGGQRISSRDEEDHRVYGLCCLQPEVGVVPHAG